MARHWKLKTRRRCTSRQNQNGRRWNCLDKMFCAQGEGSIHMHVQDFTFVLYFIFSATFVWQDHDFLTYFWHIVELAQHIKNTSRKSWSVSVSDRDHVLPRRKLSSRISEHAKYANVTRTLFTRIWFRRGGHIVKIISILELLPKILNSRHSSWWVRKVKVRAHKHHIFRE